MRELKISRLTIDVKNLEFELAPKDFEIVKEEGTRTVESGEFKIYVGGSSPMKRSIELGAPKMSEVLIAVK